jgi:tRNA G10  N-methylase Trm11
MQLAFILGRYPEISQKEIEATIATILPLQRTLHMLQGNVLLLKCADVIGETSLVENGYPTPQFLHDLQMYHWRLGGTTRIVWISEEVSKNHIEEGLARQIRPLEEGKHSFGVSVFGELYGAERLGLALKKKMKAEGFSMRYIESDKDYRQRLNTAQVFHNHLPYLTYQGEVQQRDRELVVIADRNNFQIGYTLTVQDVNDYTARDFGIPESDPINGMLPPKLAQAMINLAVGPANPLEAAVYDPFCGGGRVVLESQLMGFTAYGSDIVEEQVKSAQKNLAWLAEEYGLDSARGVVWQQDATTPTQKEISTPFYIVTEPFLGRPLRQKLKAQEGVVWQSELAALYEKFFTMWAMAKLKPEGMLVIFPRTRQADGKTLSVFDNLIDKLSEKGYSASVLASYERPDALVSRDLVQVKYRS